MIKEKKQTRKIEKETKDGMKRKAINEGHIDEILDMT